VGGLLYLRSKLAVNGTGSVLGQALLVSFAKVFLHAEFVGRLVRADVALKTYNSDNDPKQNFPAIGERNSLVETLQV